MEANFEKAVRDIQDTLVVMAHIEKRQSEYLKDLLEFRVRSEEWQAQTDERLKHVAVQLAEVTDKLNGLIGIVMDKRQGN